MKEIFKYLLCALLAVTYYEFQHLILDIDADTGLQMAFLGNIIRTIGANRQKKTLEQRRRDAGTLQDRQDKLKEFKPELKIDRSGFSAYEDALKEQFGDAKSEVDRANYNLITSSGRPQGDELARDENRRSTSNTVSRAMNTLSSGSDVLSALAIADAQERAGNRSIDAQTSAQMENNKRFAEGSRQSAVAGQNAAGARYASGMFDVASVNRDADILQYQENELNPFLQAMSDERSLDAALMQARGQLTEGFAQNADDAYSMYMKKKDDAMKLVTGLISGGAI